jgi:hypothetical protein
VRPSQDAHQPGPEGCLLAKLTELLEPDEHGLLEEILRAIWVSLEPARDPIQIVQTR